MASAHTLPNLSKKQDHLQAGKRRLEEFRKKRASGGVKKAASSNKLHEEEKPQSDVEHVRTTDSAVVSTSNNTSVFVSVAELSSDNQEMNLPTEGLTSDWKPEKRSHELANTLSDIPNNNPAFYDSYYPDKNDSLSVENNGLPKDFYFPRSGSDRFSASVEKDRLFGGPPRVTSNSVSSSYSNIPSIGNDVVHLGPHRISESRNHHNSNGLLIRRETNAPLGASQTQNVVDSESNFRNPYNSFMNLGTGNIGTRRSRTSFLDSLNITHVLRSPSSNHKSEEELNPYNRSEQGSDGQAPSFRSETPFPMMIEEPISVFADASGNSTRPGAHMELDVESLDIQKLPGFQLQKHDDGFAALEQHIEDLTQEKFSLQNSLEASRALAESLAAENSALTNSFNQQGIILSELKHDIEKLQLELRAHLAELGSVNAGFTNAQLECHAADERAKLLASEVIGLEEKALRLRSSELKLERELQQSNSEIMSHRKKISNLEKERRDLQTTVEALQEDKKKLHTKLRNTPGSGIPADIGRAAGSIKMDVSTSTEDLDARTDVSIGVASASDSDRKNDPINFDSLSSVIPPDQVIIIGNIHSLISEMASEKEELMQNLATESSRNTKLKALNTELVKKIDTQTQRLELLTAQSMARRGNMMSTNSVEPDPVLESTPMHADEGDEVVERVLEWIMKLFPGGPGRRRPNKHV